jgi:DNA primase
MSELAETIAQCKAALPLPTLWQKLGLRGEPKHSCLSPFRNEAHPSFSVFQSHGLWFWKDHATGAGGDEIDLIAHHSSLERKEAIRTYHELADVKPPKAWDVADEKSSVSRKLVATYDYLDAEGHLVHQTLRYEPKDFRQRRPAAEGMKQGNRSAKRDREGKWWLWTLEGIEPVLYRLPQLLSAPPSHTVFICEGEKDAETLAKTGAVVTTAPMGAGKWRESYTRVLKGRDVVIWPDSDEIGLQHAQRVAKALHAGGANRVRIVSWNKLWPNPPSNIKKLDVAEFATRNSFAYSESTTPP